MHKRCALLSVLPQGTGSVSLPVLLTGEYQILVLCLTPITKQIALYLDSNQVDFHRSVSPHQAEGFRERL